MRFDKKSFQILVLKRKEKKKRKKKKKKKKKEEKKKKKKEKKKRELKVVQILHLYLSFSIRDIVAAKGLKFYYQPELSVTNLLLFEHQ